MTAKAEEVVVENIVKRILLAIRPSIQRYFTHASGQALAWYTVETHHFSPALAGIATTGTLVLTSFIKRVNAWLSK